MITTKQGTVISSIQKRGMSLGVNVTRAMLHKLGWKEGDGITMQIIDRSLVLTRLDIAPTSFMSAETEQRVKGGR